jgi:hypothetical protein
LAEIRNRRNKGKFKLNREKDKKCEQIQKKQMRLSTFSPQSLQNILKTEAARTFELPEIYTISAQ